MSIENQDDRENITASSDIDQSNRAIEYLKYLEATANSKAKQSDINKLADEVNRSFYKRIKHLIPHKSV